MAAIDFPSPVSPGTYFLDPNGTAWLWNGSVWMPFPPTAQALINTVVLRGPTGNGDIAGGVLQAIDAGGGGANGTVKFGGTGSKLLQWNAVWNFSGGGTTILINGTHNVWHSGNDGAGSGMDSDTVDGKHADDSASNIPLRDANSYLYAPYFHQSSSATENPVVGAFMVTNNSDLGYLRKATVDHVRGTLGSVSPTANTLVRRDTNGDILQDPSNWIIFGSSCGIRHNGGYMEMHPGAAGSFLMNGYILPNNAGTGVDNVYTVGSTNPHRYSAFYAVNTTIQTSDRRQKTDILPSRLGLDFIRRLTPVSFKWIDGGGTPHYEDTGEKKVVGRKLVGTRKVGERVARRQVVGKRDTGQVRLIIRKAGSRTVQREVDGKIIEREEPVYEEITQPVFEDITEPVFEDITEEVYEDITQPVLKLVVERHAGRRTHWGLIAQDVKAVLDSLPEIEDFAGFVLADKNDPESEHSLGYGEFMGPMIKAIQELAAEVEALRAQLDGVKRGT